ncbi:Hsp33 family molecular chaperone HslO [Alteromonas sp. ASW11-36]|uniref:33 kDa chaperonin n=1 Tax=Alteromonas arenosi TaxID=3055817 RepID=A0ABT7T0X4_9ALTE|nr:Hsp33 family molecular chaperone HslO [Alteromonas sp. ASW11-36]MDM7862085.1 Hsp33 family molecular chaperone HslO [Alteromonas sp. ASW11-36]
MNNDQLQRYTFPDASVRGELVQLSDSYARLVGSHNYPLPVRQLLGELVAAATLLTATLKFKGEISLQIQSEGLIKYAVVDATDKQQVRGIARWDENVESWPENFTDLFHKGVLAITITPAKGERYQGLVGLTQTTLAECLEDYFTQSEQLPTKVKLFTSANSEAPKAAGLLLQVLPRDASATDLTQHRAFNDLSVLTDTMTESEILTLDAKTVMHRLYHEYDIELFAAQPVEFKCTCSRERSANALQNIDKQELLAVIAEEGQIKMDCQYCHAQYMFDALDVESIHAGFVASVNSDSNTKNLS